jgi:hypothetical protein
MGTRLGCNGSYDENLNSLNNYHKINDDQFFTVANNEKIKIKGCDIISIFPERFI